MSTTSTNYEYAKKKTQSIILKLMDSCRCTHTHTIRYYVSRCGGAPPFEREKYPSSRLDPLHASPSSSRATLLKRKKNIIINWQIKRRDVTKTTGQFNGTTAHTCPMMSANKGRVHNSEKNKIKRSYKPKFKLPKNGCKIRIIIIITTKNK